MATSRRTSSSIRAWGARSLIGSNRLAPVTNHGIDTDQHPRAFQHDETKFEWKECNVTENGGAHYVQQVVGRALRVHLFQLMSEIRHQDQHGAGEGERLLKNRVMHPNSLVNQELAVQETE